MRERMPELAQKSTSYLQGSDQFVAKCSTQERASTVCEGSASASCKSKCSTHQERASTACEASAAGCSW
eukprot:scaffold102694_cov17-Tisochrysis_lutea.AAC.1